ncbi:MAG: ABC transporter permease [Dehalococcoidales bacterium]|nr:ABC transporter permease [Dehalococcoidales bacterium]
MLSLRLAVRFLKSGRGQTVLIITGIGIAIAAQIFIGLLITSLQKTLIDRTAGNRPQITITSKSGNISPAELQAIRKKAADDPSIRTVSVSVSGTAFIEKESGAAPVLLRGLDDMAFDSIYNIDEKILQGGWDSSGEGILIGKELRDDLDLKEGDALNIQTPQGKSALFSISGIYDLGIADVNRSWIITGVPAASRFFGLGEELTAVEIAVVDLFQADVAANNLRSGLGDENLKIIDWKAQNEQLLSGLEGQSISSLMIQVFILVSVVIAIASILAITVFQKSRQIGILKAMGIKDREASLVFIYEGLIIGLFGSVAGVLIGIGLIYGFAAGTARPGEAALIDLYIDYKFIIISWAIAVLAAILAALIPARRSLRLNPIEVIREG